MSALGVGLRKKYLVSGFETQKGQIALRQKQMHV